MSDIKTTVLKPDWKKNQLKSISLFDTKIMLDIHLDIRGLF